MKRVLTLLIALITAITCATATGCGGKKNEGGFDKGGTTNLTIWITDTNQPQYFLGYFKSAFEKANPGITLTFESQTNDKLSATLDASFAGSDAPDMASTWGGSIMKGMVVGGQVEEITDTMSQFEDLMIDSALLNKIDGKHYAAPIFGFTSPTIFYNKTVFDARGWTVPQTYEELVTLCQNINAYKGADGKSVYTTMATGYTYHLMMALHARTCTKEELMKVANATATDKNVYDAEGFLKGYEWLEQMTKDGVFVPNCSGLNAVSAMSDFVMQKSLMIATTSLDLLSLSYNSQFEIGAFMFPDAPAQYKPTYGEGATENSMISGVYTDSFVVNANSSDAKKAACKKVIEFLYSKEAQEQLFNYYLYPARKDVGYGSLNTAIKPVFDSTLKGIYEQSKTDGMGVFYMTYYLKSGMMGNLESAVKRVLNGESAYNGYSVVRTFVQA